MAPRRGVHLRVTRDDVPVQVVLRLPQSLMKRVDHVGIDWDTFRSQTIERMLLIALDYIEAEAGRTDD